MDNFVLLWVMGTFLYIFHPPPTEIGIYGGPTWSESSHRDYSAILMTAGATAYAPVSERFGLRYGLAYKQGSYSTWCHRDWTDESSAGFPFPPCLARMRDQIDHIDFSMITETRIAYHDGLDMRLLFGPTWGIPVRCRAKNLTRGTEEPCSRTQEDARLVGGGRIAFRTTDRTSVAFELRYGVNLRELDQFRAEDSNGVGVATTFVAGVNYRLRR